MRELLQGVSVAAFARGNRRMIKAIKARGTAPAPDPCAHPEHAKPTHAEHCASHPAPVPPADVPHPFKVWSARLGGTAGALFVLWPLVGKWVPATLAAVVTVWVLTALVAGQEGAPEVAAAGQGVEEPDSTPQQTAPTRAETHALTASLAATEGSILLTRLTAELAASHPGWDPSTKAVRALLQETGIRVREGVRTSGGNGPGVHHQDAPSPHFPSEAASGRSVVASVGPAHSANTNTNNSQAVPSREGFVSQPDPDNPSRTIIIHAA